VAHRLSLSELARSTGIAKATLSGIEGGGANPTVGTLAQLASTLDVRVTELLDGPPAGEVRVVRAAPGESRRLDGEVRELVLAARAAEHAKPGPAGTREAVYVLSGKLLAGPVERITELDAGDYASYPADVERTYEAGRRPVRALVISGL
jgi:transcriptional regulator with XRE-family HTH domain